MIKKEEKTKSGKPDPTILGAAWHIIPKKFRKQTFAILALTLVGTILETAGIGLVIPAIALMADPNIAEKYPVFAPLLEGLGNPSHAELVIYGVILLLGAYVIKALYLAFLSLKQSDYIYAIKAHLSQNLFERYIRAPYEFHLQQNSGYLIRNISTEVEQLVIRVLIPGVLLTTELMVIAAIAALLFIIEPVGALLLFVVMGLAIYGFQHITKNKLKKWGIERQRHEGYRIQKAQEGLGGIKNAKLSGKETHFIDAYSKHSLNASLVEGKQYALSNLPRLWLETVGVLGLTVLVIVALQNATNPTDVMPIIGLFAASAFRVLPSANRILYSIQSLKYADSVIILIMKELALEQESASQEDPSFKFNQQVELKNVSYAYPNASSNSLNNVSFAIKKGESVGLIGTSGAGKSTLIDVLLGLVRPSSGGVFVDGININQNLRTWQRHIGYVQQSIFLTDETLRRNIAFGLDDDEIDDGQVMQAVKAAQLEGFVNELSEGINTCVGERGVRLSGGQQQRIGIARALYHNPPVLIFDEATSALDNETEAGVMESIRSLKGTRTMIIIAHRLSTVEHCDKVIKLERGQIVKKNN